MWAGPDWCSTLRCWISNSVDGIWLFWWELIFNIGSLIGSSALSSTVLSTVRTPLDKGSIFHVDLINRCLKFWDISCLTGMGCFVTSREDNFWKKNIWRLPFVQIAGPDFQWACNTWAATPFCFLLHSQGLSLWACSASEAVCLSFLLPFLSSDLDHDHLIVFWIPQIDLEWNSLNPLKESPLKLLGILMLC